MKILNLTLAAVLVAVPCSASFASEVPKCVSPESERLAYDWDLGGALSWIAAIAFPTSGTAELETSWSTRPDRVDTRLTIRDRNDSGYFLYRSVLDPSVPRTVLNESGYSWDGRTKIETAEFDYARRRVKVTERDTRDGPSSKIDPIPATDLEDVLTGIWSLRQRAGEITKPVLVEIYSDGTLYPVQYVPLGRRNVRVGRSERAAVGYRITAAPGQQRRWPGGVTVWFSDDAQRVPLRIEMKRSLATMHLMLTSARGCNNVPATREAQ